MWERLAEQPDAKGSLRPPVQAPDQPIVQQQQQERHREPESET